MALMLGFFCGYLYREWFVEDVIREKQYQKEMKESDRGIKENNRILELINYDGEDWMEKWDEYMMEQMMDNYQLHSEFVSQGLHFIRYGTVKDFRIDFGRTYIGMAQHFSNGFHRYLIRYCKTGESMTGYVCSQRFCDSAHIRYLFQIAVHPLVGRNRQDNTVLYALRIIPVFLYYHPGYFQQRNITHIVCLFPWLTYPVFTVYAAYNMFRCQVLDIGKS